DLIAVCGQLREQRRILGIALDEAIGRVGVVGARHAAVLREVVDADDLVTRGQQLLDEIAADETGGAGDENLHAASERESACHAGAFPEARSSSREASLRRKLIPLAL